MSHRLTDSELLTFAGLARNLFRLDGLFTEAEREAFLNVSRDLLHPEDVAGPYRVAPGAEAVPVDVIAKAAWAYIDRAAQELPDEEAVEASARAVTNPAARQMIFDAITEIAASDAITEGEWSMIEWLEKEWGMRR